jgi:8-oxo-dGTP pyrophosphatase MutT (NUDIX family)
MSDNLQGNLPKLLFPNRWLSLYEGLGGPYIATGSAVMCVPVTPEGDVLFILEPNAYDGEYTLYLPAGKIEPNEDLILCANRELQEEAGVKAARLDYLATLRPWFKYLDSKLTVFLARDFTPSRLDGDEGYIIETETLPLASFETQITSGRLRDASVIAALFLARQHLANEAARSAQT